MTFVRSIVLFSTIAVVAFAVSQKQITDTFATVDALKAELAADKVKHATLRARQEQQNTDMDIMWILINFIVMLFMIPAIAFREMGSSRVNDTQYYIVKYLFLLVASAIAFWISGYGAIFGDSPNSNRNAFIGNTDYILVSSGEGPEGNKYSLFSYEWTKAAISAAVLFSVFGERVSLLGHFVITVVYTGFIYPVSAHWLWGPAGWLSVFNKADAKNIGSAGTHGALDYAGGSVVHIAGGAGALAALVFLGARRKPATSVYNPTLVLIGVLLTWFSFYGFTAGETRGLSGNSMNSLGHHAGKITFTVTLAAAGGGLGALILSKIFALGEAFNYVDISNGIVAGLVAVSSGCGLYDEYAGFLIGFVAGILHVLLQRVLFENIFDDAHRTISIHLVSGWFGMIGTALWARKEDILRGYPFLYGRSTGIPIRYGVFYGGGAQLFGLNLLASVVVTVWSFVMVYAALFVVNWFGALRLTEAQQENGIDTEAAILEEHRGKVLEEAHSPNEPHHV